MKAYTICEEKNGFKVFNENSNGEFVKMFTIKWCLKQKMSNLKHESTANFLQKNLSLLSKKSINLKKHQYYRAISRQVKSNPASAASESVQLELIKSMGDVSCNNLPSFVQEEVINDIKTKLEELIKEQSIQPSQSRNKTLYLKNLIHMQTWKSVSL